MIQSEVPMLFRPIKEEDYPYILKSWSNEFHKIEPYNFIPNQFFFPWMKKRIDEILSKSNIMIACIDTSPDDIVGYVIYKQHDDKNIIIHWMQVKSIYRRFAVAKDFLNELETKDKNIICTNYFKLFKKLKDKYSLIFDPTILEEI